MSEIRIDDATADTSVTGVELVPVSDGGVAKSISTAQIRDFVLAAFAEEIDDTSTVSLDEDGVYIEHEGVTKRLTGTVLAQAILNYACALAGIATLNGNEIFIIDDSGTKKTITLAQLTAYITSNGSAFFDSLTSASVPLAASDLLIVRQSGVAKKCQLSNFAAYALSTFAAFLTDCVPVLNVQQTDKIAVVSGGITKYMTVAQLSSALATGVTVPGTTTTDNIPQWSNAEGGLKDGLAVGTTVRNAEAADNSTIPTEAAVRTAIANAIDGVDADVVTGPSTTTEGKIPQWDSTSKKLTNGMTLATSLSSSPSNDKLPTEKAVKDAIDAEATARGTAITSAVSAEATARNTAITSAVSAEATARNTAITNAVSAEATARDAAITNAVSAEATARDAAITNATQGMVTGPSSTTQNKIPRWGSTAKTLTDGLTVVESIGETGENSKIPTEKAVRDAITGAAGVGAPEGTPTNGNIPTWGVGAVLTDGKSIQASVRNAANASHDAIPTEKAVRSELDGKISMPLTHNEDCIPTWGPGSELKAGMSVVPSSAGIASATNASDEKIPTEKAVRNALPVAATTSTAGLMSAADKAKLDNFVDTTAVAEVGDTGLADSDVLTVLKNGTTWKKALITRLWTWLMGKLSTFKLDAFAVPDDNTNLNASASAHGLCPKLPGGTDKFLRGDGTFAEPAGTTDFTGDSGSGGAHGLVPAPASGDAAANKFLNANGQWTEAPGGAGVDIPGAQAVGSAAAADMLYCFDESENAYRKVSLSQIAAFVMGVHRYDNIFIPSGAMVPSVTNGATPGALTFTNVKRDTMAFSNAAEQGAEFSVVMPEDWDGGTVRAKLMWTAYDATKAEHGEIVAWKIGAVSTPDEGAITVAPTNYVTVTDNLSQVNELHRTGATGHLAAEGTRGAGNLVHFVVKRDPTAETANPMDTDALLLGVWIQYGRTSSVTEEWL